MLDKFRLLKRAFCQQNKIFMLLCAVLLSGCSIIKNQFFNTTGDFLLSSLDVIYQEVDLKLAEQFLTNNLKLIEILAIKNESNKKLNLIAAQAFGAYTMAFLDEKEPERAANFYQRGLHYAFKALPKRIAFTRDINHRDLEQILCKAKASDVPALFWLGYNWGQVILTKLDKPEMLADLAKVELIMRRVLELNENYNFGGVHLFYALYYSARPPLLGGNPEKGKMHFERNLTLTKNQFNLTKYFYARYYAVQIQDLELFDKLIKEIMETDLDQNPDIRFFNALAKMKASELNSKRNYLFDLE